VVIDIPSESGQTSMSAPQTTPVRHPDTSQAEVLVRRAPMGFFWNQLYQLWLYGTSLLLNLVVARALPPQQYGVYSTALTAFNTAIYLLAFGLEEAATIWVPRALTEEGREQASSVIRRLLGVRVLFLLVVCAAMLFLLPAVPGWLDQLSFPGAHGVASVLGDPAVQNHLTPLVFYVGGYGLVNLLFAFFTALLRTRVILVVSGCSQGATLLFAWIVLRLGGEVDGVLWIHSAVTWLTALVYFFWLAPLLLVRRPRKALSLRPALRLGVAAWLTNLAVGALLKQVAIWLLVLYGFSDAQKGFFNLAFQLGHSAGALLVAGLSFVGMATMAAAYTDENRSWLATSWRAVLKVQTVLGLPLLVFSMLHAQAIVTLLYKEDYAAVGPLLQLFLALNIATRIAGGGFHQAALYVLGKQRVVVIIQWLALALTVLLGFLFIPQFGPLGALIATGLPPALVELAQLAVLWLSLRRPYPLHFMLRYALALLPPIIAGLLWQPHDWLGLAGAGGLFTILLIGALLLVKPLEGEDAALLGKTNSWLRTALMLLIRKSAVPAAELAAPDVTP